MRPSGKSPVKIVATLGPASATAKGVKALALAGARVFRINLSHATPEEAMERLRLIRKAEKETGIPLLALGDLAGPKIRIGQMAPDALVQRGDRVEILAKTVVGDATRFSVERPEIIPALAKGSLIYLGDGDIQLEVVETGDKRVVARVRIGGVIKSRKGFVAHNMPVMRFALTAQDKKHIQALVPAGIDALALSFVQSPADVRQVAKLLPPPGKRPLLVAKIETQSGVDRASEILHEVDALMVARGDLGFAVPLPSLPHAQKQLIDLALAAGKPVITATQMLESMTQNPVPTRAEVTDVANAILDGTDAVMLSGETASGIFPEEAVATMHGIADEASTHVEPRDYDVASVTDSVCASVVQTADDVNAKLIVVFTDSGATARHISRHKPQQPILALSPNLATVRALQLSWGVHATLIKAPKSLEDAVRLAERLIVKESPVSLGKGEPYVISASLPFKGAGATNLLLVQRA